MDIEINREISRCKFFKLGVAAIISPELLLITCERQKEPLPWNNFTIHRNRENKINTWHNITLFNKNYFNRNGNYYNVKLTHPGWVLDTELKFNVKSSSANITLVRATENSNQAQKNIKFAIYNQDPKDEHILDISWQEPFNRDSWEFIQTTWGGNIVYPKPR